MPFANLKLTHRGHRYSLHDYFFARSVDALKPGGVLALVTSHFTLDKQNAELREYLAEQADFLGAIRLPSDAFKQEGTKVVTDIVFLRKREPGVAAQHADPDWLSTEPMNIEGTEAPVNRYFHQHGKMVLGKWSKENQLYGGSSFSIQGEGDLAAQLAEAIHRLPQVNVVHEYASQSEATVTEPFRRPPAERHIGEGSLFVGEDKNIYQVNYGQAEPVTHGSTKLSASGTMMGRRLAALIGLRDAARLVLQAQNEGWPEADRDDTRKSLGRLYDQFVSAYGPINKTTFSETADGTVIRRMPNLINFREDPDSMLVLSLEDYDEVTGKATKAAIFGLDVVGRKPPVDRVTTAEAGLLASLDQKGGVDLPFIAQIYGKSEIQIVGELGDLIYLNPATGVCGRRPMFTFPVTCEKSSLLPKRPVTNLHATPSDFARCNRGCIAGRYRRQSRRALGAGVGHPSLCLRAVSRTALRYPHWPSEERRRLECRCELRCRTLGCRHQ